MSIEWEGITWGLAAAIWLLLALLPRLAGLRLPPQPGPPTLEPGPESPAVASLLVFGARRAAVPATVLDLGARGFLDLAWMGPSLLGCRGVQVPERTQLLPFERRVLERLRTRLHGEPVPVSVLLPAPGNLRSRPWYRRFAGEVTAVALQAGLVRPQLPAGPRRLLLLAAVVPAALAAFFIWRSSGLGTAGHVAAVLVAAGVLVAAWVLLPRGVRATEAGREAASRWLGVLDSVDVERWQGQTPLRDPVHARVAVVGADSDLMAAFRPQRPRTFVGRVALRFQQLDGEAVSWYLVVEGSGPKTRAWTVGRELFDRFTIGSQVRATVDGRGRLLWLASAT